jgi:hypothetical protein
MLTDPQPPLRCLVCMLIILSPNRRLSQASVLLTAINPVAWQFMLVLSMLLLPRRLPHPRVLQAHHPAHVQACTHNPPPHCWLLPAQHAHDSTHSKARTRQHTHIIIISTHTTARHASRPFTRCLPTLLTANPVSRGQCMHSKSTLKTSPSSPACNPQLCSPYNVHGVICCLLPIRTAHAHSTIRTAHALPMLRLPWPVLPAAAGCAAAAAAGVAGAAMSGELR